MSDAKRRPNTQHGFDFEESFAKKIGGSLKPGSGNQWFARGDIGQRGVTFSLKSTQNKNYEIKQSDVDEIIEICEGPGGDGRLPMMAINIAGYELVMARADDFFDIIRGEITIEADMAKDKILRKRKKANTPQLFREEDD